MAQRPISSEDEPHKRIEIHAVVRVDAELDDQSKRVTPEVKSKQKENDVNVANKMAQRPISSEDEPHKRIEIHAIVRVDAELDDQSKRVTPEVKSAANKNEKNKLLNYPNDDNLDENITTEEQGETLGKVTDIETLIQMYMVEYENSKQKYIEETENLEQHHQANLIGIVDKMDFLIHTQKRLQEISEDLKIYVSDQNVNFPKINLKIFINTYKTEIVNSRVTYTEEVEKINVNHEAKLLHIQKKLGILKQTQKLINNITEDIRTRLHNQNQQAIFK